MANVALSYAGGDYDRTRPLIDGRVRPEGIDLTYLPMLPPEAFFRMVRFKEFDASEMSLAATFIGWSRGERDLVAIPAFPSRMFRHACIYVNRQSGVRHPRDLKGKRFGIPEYQITAAVWVRAFLEHDYGVSPRDVEWFTGGVNAPGREERIRLDPPPGVAVHPIGPDRTLNAMLLAGEIDALMCPALPRAFLERRDTVDRLFPDFREVETDYFRRTGIFPIMHTVVIRRPVYERHPFAARSLFDAFCRAQDLASRALYTTEALPVSLTWAHAVYEEDRALLGERLWDHGLAANRKVLETLLQYCGEQGLLAGPVDLEAVFAPSVREPIREG
jgi:4,5-dihydroxyphthalate decarboxylase